ncbi:MAG: hypothetical protein HYY32_04820, partial [Chloroflexi bacterium]|nr:hypothetical protein [Chloroflexota bacterium]
IKPAEGDEVKVKFGSNTIFLIKGSPALAFGADVVVLAKVNEDGSLLAKVVNAGVKRPAISKLPKPRPLAG